MKTKQKSRLYLQAVLILFPVTGLLAEVNQDEREALMAEVGRVMQENYILPDRVPGCLDEMTRAIEEPAFEGTLEDDRFIELFSQALKTRCHDKHLRIAVRPREDGLAVDESRWRQQRSTYREQAAQNFGFAEAKVLDGNIGYVEMTYFRPPDVARDTAAAAFAFVRESRAVVLDLRRNKGGHPSMVAFVAGYFFDEPVHLNTFYRRDSEEGVQLWSRGMVPGRRLSDKPLYILTSSRTGSAAEGFAYHMKHLGRATLIGETTAGAAHPGSYYPLDERFRLFVPDGRPVNPVTQTNWEGTGVIPDVPVPANEALDRAISLIGTPPEAEEALPAYADLMDRAAGTTSPEGARSFLSEAARLAPGEPWAWAELAWICHLAGDLDPAMQAYEKAASFPETRVFALYQMGAIRSLQGRIDESFDLLERAKDAGFSDLDSFRIDSDLDNIRNDSRFPALLR